MNRFIILLFSVFLIPQISFAQGSLLSPVIKQMGKGFDDLVPKNWNVIMADSGDFNDDHFEDYTLIIEADKDYLNSNNYNTKFNAPPRILLILFGALNDTVTLALKADSAIMRANSGEGDPLAQGTGLKTDGNIFEVNYSGGLSVQWTAQYRYIYKNKDWTLQYYKGTEYNTADEDAPIKVYEIDFNKKTLKQDKLKTPMPNLPKIRLENSKPKTVEIAPGIVI